MAEPKKKRSKSRQGNSRSHKNGLGEIAIARCLQCKQPVLPHRACKNCGNYKGAKVLKVSK